MILIQVRLNGTRTLTISMSDPVRDCSCSIPLCEGAPVSRHIHGNHPWAAQILSQIGCYLVVSPDDEDLGHPGNGRLHHPMGEQRRPG